MKMGEAENRQMVFACPANQDDRIGRWNDAVQIYAAHYVDYV